MHTCRSSKHEYSHTIYSNGPVRSPINHPVCSYLGQLRIPTWKGIVSHVFFVSPRKRYLARAELRAENQVTRPSGSSRHAGSLGAPLPEPFRRFFHTCANSKTRLSVPASEHNGEHKPKTRTFLGMLRINFLYSDPSCSFDHSRATVPWLRAAT